MRLNRDDFCEFCSLNDNAHCGQLPECPLRNCEACGDTSHSLDGCPVVFRTIHCERCHRTLDACNCG